MEINVLNINGENTGRKVTLNESILLTNAKVQLKQKKEVNMLVLHANSVARKVAVAHVAVISIHLFS